MTPDPIASPVLPLPAVVPYPEPVVASKRLPTLIEGIDPELVSAAVLSCASVSAMSGGPGGAAATYLPGRTVPGVRITPSSVEVHVVSRYGPTAFEVATQVRTALRRALGAQVRARSIDIVIEDIEVQDIVLPGTPVL